MTGSTLSWDRAAATFSNAARVELEAVQLRRTPTGEWLIDKLGTIGPWVHQSSARDDTAQRAE